MDIDENTGQGTPPSQPGADVEQFLLHQFSRMGTTDHDELVNQLQKVLGNQLNYNTARFFLDMNNWYVLFQLGHIQLTHLIPFLFGRRIRSFVGHRFELFLFCHCYCLFRHVQKWPMFEVMCECFYFEILFLGHTFSVCAFCRAVCLTRMLCMIVDHFLCSSNGKTVVLLCWQWKSIACIECCTVFFLVIFPPLSNAFRCLIWQYEQNESHLTPRYLIPILSCQ